MFTKIRLWSQLQKMLGMERSDCLDPSRTLAMLSVDWFVDFAIDMGASSSYMKLVRADTGSIGNCSGWAKRVGSARRREYLSELVIASRTTREMH